MQIQKIANTNFGSSMAYEKVKNDPNLFYSMRPENKQDVLYDMLQIAHKERKTIVKNQKKLLDYMADGMEELAKIVDIGNDDSVYEVFENRHLENI